MKKTKWLSRELISGPFLCLCLSEDEFKTALDYLKVDDKSLWCPVNGARTHFYKKDGECETCIVCMSSTKGKTVAQISAMLAHEAVHVWQYFCQSIGEDRPSEEFEAYSVQNIVQTLMQEYSGRKSRK